MKFKFFKMALAGLVLFTSLFANAGLIDLEDVDINSDGTNQGFTLSTNNYDLIWMDFGIYNGTSLTDMNNLLNGSLTGWRYATYDESLVLFSVMFSEYLTDSTNYSLNTGNGDNSDAIFSTALSDIIGINDPISWNPNPGFIFNQSEGGITNGTDIFGRMSLGGFVPTCTGCGTGGSIYETTANEGLDSNHSWMIVKEVVDVPEPSTLAIFALGMIGLASRRFKK
jgi:hypothetical protein